MTPVYTVWFRRDRSPGWSALVSAVALRLYKHLDTARARAQEKSREYGVSPVVVIRGRRLEDLADDTKIMATFERGQEVVYAEGSARLARGMETPEP